MTMLPLINYSTCDWRPWCLFDFQILNKCKCIGTRKVNIWLASCLSQCNSFLVFDIALIRWTLLQSKRTAFVGQNLKAKQIVFAGWRKYVTVLFSAQNCLQILIHSLALTFATTRWIDNNINEYNCVAYSLCPAKTVRLAFKFCPTKTVRLDCNKVHLIKSISNTKK